MAKVKAKTGLSKLNKALFIIFIILLVATILIVTLSPADAPQVANTGSTEDVSVLDAEFKAGTYGGVEFKTQEDVIDYYKKCYDYTKTLTEEYDENGNKVTYYKMIGEEDLKIHDLLVEGKANGTINGIVDTILPSLFKGGVNGLAPSGNRNPDLDKKGENDKYDCRTSTLEYDDVLACNVSETADGKIQIVIQPKAVILSMPMEDAQGRFFNTLGDISSTVEKISVLSFSEGTIDENFVVDYKGGVGTITIDPASGEIVEADYVMEVHIDVKHANVTIFTNKNASLNITYRNKFPATDQYLKETKGITRLK